MFRILRALGITQTEKPSPEKVSHDPRAQALHTAVQLGDTDYVEKLLDQGVNVDIANPTYNKHYEITPLHTAAEADQPECARILIRRGASMTANNVRGGYTAFEFAKLTGHISTITAMIAECQEQKKEIPSYNLGELIINIKDFNSQTLLPLLKLLPAEEQLVVAELTVKLIFSRFARLSIYTRKTLDIDETDAFDRKQYWQRHHELLLHLLTNYKLTREGMSRGMYSDEERMGFEKLFELLQNEMSPKQALDLAIEEVLTKQKPKLGPLLTYKNHA